ncbi:MAG: guanylate kinase, partial [Deltaproteobacteria bacterium]
MSEVRRRGSLIIVSGPSGAGKTSVCGPLLERVSGMRVSVSTTTRRPRAGEHDGVDYYFVDDAEFDRMIRAGEFAEWATVHGFRYG